MVEESDAVGDAGPDWRVSTNFVAVAILAMTAAFMLVRTARDALYFQGNGLFDLPKAYLGISLASLPVALGMLELMRRVGTRRARVIACSVVAGALVVFAPLARPGGGVVMTVFFVMVPLVFGVLFSAAWLLAADLLDRARREQQARAYARIGAASMLGGVAAASVAKVAAAHMVPQALIVMGALLLAASAAVLAWAHHAHPLQVQRRDRTQDSGPRVFGGATKPGWRDFRAAASNPYTLRLLGIGALTSLVGVLVEFQFYSAVAVSGNSAQENVGVFANVYLVLGALAFALQVMIVPRIQNSIGVHRSLLILPSGLLAALASMILSPTGFTRSLLRLIEGGLKSSVHRANWEQTYITLPSEQRPVAKLLVDGGGARLGEGLAAGLLQAWLGASAAGMQAMNPFWITVAIAGGLVVWIAVTASLGRPLRECAALQSGADLRLDVPLPDT